MSPALTTLASPRIAISGAMTTNGLGRPSPRPTVAARRTGPTVVALCSRRRRARVVLSASAGDDSVRVDADQAEKNVEGESDTGRCGACRGSQRGRPGLSSPFRSLPTPPPPHHRLPGATAPLAASSSSLPPTAREALRDSQALDFARLVKAGADPDAALMTVMGGEGALAGAAAEPAYRTKLVASLTERAEALQRRGEMGKRELEAARQAYGRGETPRAVRPSVRSSIRSPLRPSLVPSIPSMRTIHAYHPCANPPSPGNYDDSLTLARESASLAGPDSAVGGDAQMYEALALAACGREEASLEVYRTLEETHPLPMIRKQAANLRYIAEAPKMALRPDERVVVPVLSGADTAGGGKRDRPGGRPTRRRARGAGGGGSAADAARDEARRRMEESAWSYRPPPWALNRYYQLTATLVVGLTVAWEVGALARWGLPPPR